MVRTFFGVDKKYVIYHIIHNISRVPFVVSLRKNVLLSLSKNDCRLFKVYDRRMINKEMWTQKLSGILLNYYYLYFFNWTFLSYVPGRWPFFGSGSSLKDFFWV